jgi:hypothetical protein
MKVIGGLSLEEISLKALFSCAIMIGVIFLIANSPNRLAWL